MLDKYMFRSMLADEPLHAIKKVASCGLNPNIEPQSGYSFKQKIQYFTLTGNMGAISLVLFVSDNDFYE